MCESHTSPWKQYPREGFILIVIFVLLCILVPLQAAHVRVHTCVYICAHLAFAVLGVWLPPRQPPFPPDQGIPRAPGPVSAVGETELLPWSQVLSAGSLLPRGLCLLSSYLYETVQGGE